MAALHVIKDYFSKVLALPLRKKLTFQSFIFINIILHQKGVLELHIHEFPRHQMYIQILQELKCTRKQISYLKLGLKFIYLVQNKARHSMKYL